MKYLKEHIKRNIFPTKVNPLQTFISTNFKKVIFFRISMCFFPSLSCDLGVNK